LAYVFKIGGPASFSGQVMTAGALIDGERIEQDGVAYDVIAVREKSGFYGGWACGFCDEHGLTDGAHSTAKDAICMAKFYVFMHHAAFHDPASSSPA